MTQEINPKASHIQTEHPRILNPIGRVKLKEWQFRHFCPLSSFSRIIRDEFSLRT
jgi:hypothetical protein